MIPQIQPWIDANVKLAVTDYLDSGGWLTEFRRTEEFENEIANFLQVKNCILVPNGTIALTLACMIYKEKYPDKPHIIVPDMTMIATANAVRAAGLHPILVDVDGESSCLDVGLVEHFSSWYVGVSGVLYVNFNGQSNNLKEISEICRRNNWFFIEDACQAFGSKLKNRALGTIGEIGCFSLSPHKIITTGQGGFLVTNNDAIAQRLRELKDFGRIKSGVDDHRSLGFNFKFTDIQAVIGSAQLTTINKRLDVKKALYTHYYNNLKDCQRVRIRKIKGENIPWFVDVYSFKRDAIIKALEEHEIGFRKMYPPVHTQAPYRYVGATKQFKNSVLLSTTGIWLPSSLILSTTEIDMICAVIKKATQ